MLGGHFKPGEYHIYDVRSGEVLRHALGNATNLWPTSSGQVHGLNGSQLLNFLRQAGGVTIGQNVFIDFDVEVQDAEMVAIGNDTVICAGGSIGAHDLVGGASNMMRQPTVLPAARRVGECCRIGAGTLVASRGVAPYTFTITNERI